MALYRTYANERRNAAALATGGVVILLFAFALTLLVGCGTASPDANQEAVLIRKPVFFGHGGLEPVPIRTGRTYVAPSTQVLYVNTSPLAFDLNFDDLMTRDVVPLDFHGQLRLQVTDSVALVKAGAIGSDGAEVNVGQWFKNNLQAQWIAALRDAVKKHPHGEVLTTSVDQIDAEVKAELEALIAKEKLPVRLLSVTAGRANPPPQVASQRIATATQQQKVQTEIERRRAEEARRDAEFARAEADNAYRQEMTITADQFVQMEMMKLSATTMREVCGGGKGNCSFTIVPDAAGLFNVVAPAPVKAGGR